MKLVVALALFGMVAIAGAVEAKPAYGYDKGGYKGGYEGNGGYDQYGGGDGYGYQGYDNSAYDGYGYDKHGCRCKVECKDVPIKKCNVTTVTVNKCTNVTKEVDILECSTVCKKPEDYKGYKYDTKAEPAAATEAKVAYAKDVPKEEYLEGDYDKEICKEVCVPAKMTVTTPSLICADVTSKQYDCGETITNKKCTKDCICGEKHYDDYGYAKQN